jgi:hypothetical protein
MPSSEPKATRLKPLFFAAITILADLVLVVVLAFGDTSRATTVGDLSNLEFGIPFKWLLQAQHLDPPMPYDATLLSPLENPSSILWLGLVGNVIGVGLALAIVGAGIGMVIRKAHRTTVTSPGRLEGPPE